MAAQLEFSPLMLVRGLAGDVGLPLASYYGLHLLGVGDFAALVTATAAAALRIIWGALRNRSLNPFATVMLLMFGIGLTLSFVIGDPRFLLLKGSIVTATVGTIALITALRGRRPLTLAAQQSWAPSRARELAEQYRNEAHTRRAHRFCSTVWGAVLLAEAAVRVPLVYLLPIRVMVGVSGALLVATLAGLIAWNTRYVAQLNRRAQEHDTPTPSGPATISYRPADRSR